MTQSAVSFRGEARVHIGLEVGDLERSIAFYRLLLGEEPVKLRPGYAKFEPESPSLNLSLNAVSAPGATAHRAHGGHFGVQVQSTDAVVALTRRLEQAGLATRTENTTTCCYAVQDKVWADDPDGNSWEVFVVTQADAPERRSAETECCVPTSAPAASTESKSSCCGD